MKVLRDRVIGDGPFDLSLAHVEEGEAGARRYAIVDGETGETVTLHCRPGRDVRVER